MYIRLIRNEPQGNVLTGRLLIDDAFACDTLEHWQYAIPAGFYRVRLTYSPRFQEILPILDHVYGFAREPHDGTKRTGIRIHAGNTIEHTRGCILLGDRQEAKGTKTKTEQKRRLSFKEKRELEDLEKLLPKLETEKAQLETLLSGGATNADDIAKASKRYQEVQDALDEAELRWLELSEVEG